MKNTIYNAIQNGLTNALVIDGDSSISYQKSYINNESKIPKVLLEELHDIFKINNNDIFKYNTSECLTLILDNNQEISLHEYKPNNKPIFLKISNDTLKNTGNEIIIACDNEHHLSPITLYWQTDYTEILPAKYLIKNLQIAINDFDGYKKYQKILDRIKNKTNLNNLPAIKYCKYTGNPLPNYIGYLPSAGQLIFILKYLDIINYIFKYTGFNILNCNSLWSSSEASYSSAWAIYAEDINDHYKRASNRVLPLFHLKIND